MNPKFTKFLEENPNITLVGMGWSLIWRLYAVLIAVAFGLGLVSALLQ